MRISDQTYEACPVCDNEGEVKVGDNASMTCPACSGLGLVPHTCPSD
jgi:DnaJ-class molecular chaperone